MKSAKKVFFGLIGLNLLLILVILLTFTLASGVAQKKSLKISELKAQVETNNQAIANYKQLEKLVEANKDVEQIAQKVLPSDKEQSAALAEIDKFSKEVNMPIKQLSFKATANKTNTQTLIAPSTISGVSVLSVTLEADKTKFENVLAFLKRVENNQRRMQVTSVAITPSQTEADILEKVTLLIDIYLKS